MARVKRAVNAQKKRRTILKASHVDYEYLMALGDGIKKDAAKVGGEPFFAFVLESFSNAITVTLSGETRCRDPLAKLDDLYKEHVGMLGVGAVTRALP
jgi:hypothetical protein